VWRVAADPTGGRGGYRGGSLCALCDDEKLTSNLNLLRRPRLLNVNKENQTPVIPVYNNTNKLLGAGPDANSVCESSKWHRAEQG